MQIVPRLLLRAISAVLLWSILARNVPPFFSAPLACLQPPSPYRPLPPHNCKAGRLCSTGQSDLRRQQGFCRRTGTLSSTTAPRPIAERSTNQSTNQPTTQPATQPTNQPTNQPTTNHQPTNHSTNQLINQPVNQPVNQVTYQLTSQSINQSIN